MADSVKTCYFLGFVLALIGLDLVKDASCTGPSCCRQHGTSIDCRKCELLELPLSLMNENITQLHLQDNRISTIPDGSFENMTSLQILNLWNNPLQLQGPQRLNRETFRGLGLLQHFGIGTYQQDQYYHAEIFAPLTNVKGLNLGCIYPDQLERGFLQHMQKIESFSVQWWKNATLGEEFGQLKNLKSLTIEPGPKIEYNGIRTLSMISIKDNTLAHVPHLEKLTIYEVLVSMSPNALRPLTNLSELCLFMNIEFPLEDAFVAIKNMKSATLTKLMLDGSHNDQKFSSLTPDMFNSQNFEKVRLLSAQNTRVLEIDLRIFFKCPSLRYLNIGFNSFIRNGNKGGDFTLYSLMKNPQKMAHFMNSVRLVSLNINSFHSPINDRQFGGIFLKNRAILYPEPPKWIEVPKNLTIKRTPKDFINLDIRETLRFIFPTLRYLHARHLPSDSVRTSHRSYTALENGILYIDLSHTKFPQHVSLIIGFNQLQAIDLKGCGINSFHRDQLLHSPSLKYLNLTRNQLDLESFAQMNKEGSKLKWLDLSFNNLKSLPIDLLTGMTTLKSVSFRGNPLVTVDLNIQDNIDLEMLDFSDCALDNITESFMYKLNNFQANKTKNLMVNFSGNQFECSCSSFSMIRWFQESQVDIVDKGNINCTYQNTSIAILTLDYDKVTKDCASAPVDLLVIFTPLSLVFILLVTLILVYHFKWQLKWFIYKTKRRIRLALNSHDQDILLADLQFDIFVSHDHSDADWVVNELYEVIEIQRGFKICLAQRDFLGGVPIAENIADAIDRCKKTVLIVTPAFVSSSWCIFEMHMALMKGLHTIVIVYKEEVPLNDMCKTLQSLIKTITYIEYPADEAEIGAFWDRLCLAISKNY